MNILISWSTGNDSAWMLHAQADAAGLPLHVVPLPWPCGENGEFHSFAHTGPMFNHAIAIRLGEIVDRDGFVFADVLPL